MDIRDSEQVIKLAGGVPPVHPALLARPQMRAALASHDIGTVFRVLNDNGWTQRQIGDAAGMSQSQVSEIIKGRRVRAYRVLVRIADGLQIPRDLMNLGPAEGSSAYPGDWLVALACGPGAEVDEEMLRRAVIALGGAALAGKSAGGVGELSLFPALTPVPSPSRLQGIHVVQVRELTRTLWENSRAYGSNPELSSTAAAWATRLLESSGPESVTQAVLAAVAELHIQAGYAAFGASLADRTLYHFAHGLKLATAVGDTTLQVVALNFSGMATVLHGHPNDGLAMLQLSQAIAAHIPVDDQRERICFRGSRAVLTACARADSALALARMDDPKGAAREFAKARELWQPTAADPSGDLNIVGAELELDRGRLAAAEAFAAASVRRWAAGHEQVARTYAEILLATIHVQAGESDGVILAHRAITGATQLSSLRVRQRLIPLADALDARPSTDHRNLAHLARQVATTRA